MEKVWRIFCGLLLLGVISLQTPVYAEEGEFQEIIAEAVYPIGPSDTLAKAEAQAFLLAEQNVLAQLGLNGLSVDDLGNLPETVFSAIVLDKKKTVSNNRLAYWMQIKALVKPDQVETALKSINPILGGPAEYYTECVAYSNGKESARYKIWTKNAWSRTETLSGESQGITNIKKYEKVNGVISQRTWYFKNDKYYESPVERYASKSEQLGTEQLNGEAVQKVRETTTYPEIPNFMLVTIKWVDPATKTPLKWQSEVSGYTTVMTYQNQQIGPQDDSLFVIPAGYTKCASIMDLFSVPAANNNNPTTNNSVDPLQKATDAALEAAAQKVVDNAIGGLFSF